MSFDYLLASTLTVTDVLRWASRRVAVPTDVIKALALKNRTLAEARANNTIIVMWFIVSLAVLVCLFASPSLVQAETLIGEME
jgi:hypothetical protein